MKKLLLFILPLLFLKASAQDVVDTGSTLQPSTLIYLKNITDTVNRRVYIYYPKNGHADRLPRWSDLLRNITTTAPTQLITDSSLFIANTAWVKQYSYSLTKYLDSSFFDKNFDGSFGNAIKPRTKVILDTLRVLNPPTNGFDAVNLTYFNSHTGGALTNPLTVNNSGTGDVSPFTFNGSAAKTISYNSIGAQVAGTYLTPSSTNTISNKDFTGTGNTWPIFNQATTSNAGSATKLATPRNIQGVAFDGTANIDPINGTGFVKVIGTALSYDNSNYLTTSNFVYNEVPSGTINGSNVTFTLANTPTTGTVRLYINGLRMDASQYSITGATITYSVAPSNTGFSDKLLADYLK
jgi:hypothetical protein